MRCWNEARKSPQILVSQDDVDDDDDLALQTQPPQPLRAMGCRNKKWRHEKSEGKKLQNSWRRNWDYQTCANPIKYQIRKGTTIQRNSTKEWLEGSTFDRWHVRVWKIWCAILAGITEITGGITDVLLHPTFFLMLSTWEIGVCSWIGGWFDWGRWCMVESMCCFRRYSNLRNFTQESYQLRFGKVQKDVIGGNNLWQMTC